MIEMKDIMKKYSNGTTAIRNLSISIDQGSRAGHRDAAARIAEIVIEEATEKK
jgi:hypothetical protein